MKKIQKGDEVIVIAGKSKGQKGKVLSVVTETNKLIVENVNVAKKHVKPNPSIDEEGGILSKEMPIDLSNVAIYNPKADKADKVGIRFKGDKKERFYKSSGDPVI